MTTIDILREKSEKFDAALARARAKLAPGGALEAGAAIGIDDVTEAVRSGSAEELPGGGLEMRSALEAIILEDLRPAYLFENDQITIHGDYDRIDLIESNKDMLESVSKNIGRVDLLNHATMEYVGTGWLVDHDIVVTNRHVANVFSQPRWEGGWEFKTGSFGRTLRVELDFMRQHQQPASAQRFAKVSEILFVAPQGGPDMAFLRVVPDAGLEPVELLTGPVGSDRPVATVGYPAWDGRRNDSDLMDDIFGGIYDVKRFSPGMINGTDAQGIVILGDYTSLGGNSGSAVLDLESGKAVGLHFAGVFRDTNYAVAADIVAAALRDVSSPQVMVELDIETPATEAVDLTGRKGYDPDFLGTGTLSVPFPDLGARSDDLAPVQGDEDKILRYTHFSVLQSKSRRLPMLTAVNIDGAQAFRLKRKGQWRLDGRLQRAHQMGNELYRYNPMDRGHMVRRMDPGWGASRDEAQQAEIDTFHYTNSAPQHKDLNQRDWVGLEDYILEAASTRDFRVSVMTGPVFRDNDRRLVSQPGAEDVQIPESFWKIAVMINDDTGKMSATGYVLTQGEMIRDITEAAFVLGQYQTYQVNISRIEAETGFDWGTLRDHDPLKDCAEGVFGESVRPIHGPSSLVL
ncbi:DNA/RNA non-specific endonuclease [Arenibacterium sp. CAU 1754]